MANRDSFDDFETDDQDDGFLTFDARDEEEDRSRGPLVIAAIVAVLLICGVILWQLYSGGKDTNETPEIAADAGAIKAAPADTSGAVTDDIDKGVFDSADGTEAPPLDILPAAGADDPLLADGGTVPAPTVQPAPIVVPKPTPAPPRQVAVAPVPRPVPPPVSPPVAKPAPVKVAAATPPPRPVGVPKVAVAAPKVVPAPTPVPAPVAVAATAPAAAPKAAPSPARAASTGGIGAQLGSFQTRASADTALAQYRASGLSGPVTVVAANLGAKGTWYRIRATGFDTRAEVESFCSKARGAGAQCIPSGR